MAGWQGFALWSLVLEKKKKKREAESNPGKKSPLEWARRAGQFATALTAHYVGLQLGPSVALHRPDSGCTRPSTSHGFSGCTVVWWSPTRHLCLWLLSSFVFSRTEKSTSQTPHPAIRAPIACPCRCRHPYRRTARNLPTYTCRPHLRAPIPRPHCHRDNPRVPD